MQSQEYSLWLQNKNLKQTRDRRSCLKRPFCLPTRTALAMREPSFKGPNGTTSFQSVSEMDTPTKAGRAKLFQIASAHSRHRLGTQCTCCPQPLGPTLACSLLGQDPVAALSSPGAQAALLGHKLAKQGLPSLPSQHLQDPNSLTTIPWLCAMSTLAGVAAVGGASSPAQGCLSSLCSPEATLRKHRTAGQGGGG